MAPVPARHAALIWSLPALAALLSLLWYRRRRARRRSDSACSPDAAAAAAARLQEPLDAGGGEREGAFVEPPPQVVAAKGDDEREKVVACADPADFGRVWEQVSVDLLRAWAEDAKRGAPACSPPQLIEGSPAQAAPQPPLAAAAAADSDKQTRGSGVGDSTPQGLVEKSAPDHLFTAACADRRESNTCTHSEARETTASCAPETAFAREAAVIVSAVEATESEILCLEEKEESEIVLVSELVDGEKPAVEEQCFSKTVDPITTASISLSGSHPQQVEESKSDESSSGFVEENITSSNVSTPTGLETSDIVEESGYSQENIPLTIEEEVRKAENSVETCTTVKAEESADITTEIVNNIIRSKKEETVAAAVQSSNLEIVEKSGHSQENIPQENIPQIIGEEDNKVEKGIKTRPAQKEKQSTTVTTEVTTEVVNNIIRSKKEETVTTAVDRSQLEIAEQSGHSQENIPQIIREEERKTENSVKTCPAQKEQSADVATEVVYNIRSKQEETVAAGVDCSLLETVESEIIEETKPNELLDRESSVPVEDVCSPVAPTYSNNEVSLEETIHNCRRLLKTFEPRTDKEEAKQKNGPEERSEEPGQLGGSPAGKNSETPEIASPGTQAAIAGETFAEAKPSLGTVSSPEQNKDDAGGKKKSKKKGKSKKNPTHSAEERPPQESSVREDGRKDRKSLESAVAENVSSPERRVDAAKREEAVGKTTRSPPRDGNRRGEDAARDDHVNPGARAKEKPADSIVIAESSQEKAGDIAQNKEVSGKKKKKSKNQNDSASPGGVVDTSKDKNKTERASEEKKRKEKPKKATVESSHDKVAEKAEEERKGQDCSVSETEVKESCKKGESSQSREEKSAEESQEVRKKKKKNNKVCGVSEKGKIEADRRRQEGEASAEDVKKSSSRNSCSPEEVQHVTVEVEASRSQGSRGQRTPEAAVVSEVVMEGTSQAAPEEEQQQQRAMDAEEEGEGEGLAEAVEAVAPALGALRVDTADGEATDAGGRAPPTGPAKEGRDSANHSPAEGMLGSPRLCYSDVPSEDSSDSGKGCSDVPTPPSRTPASGSSVAGDPGDPQVYEFVLPQHLVGRLIGRHGCFVQQIKARTNASILIKRHPETARLKVCAVEGAPLDVEAALDMIRAKFPAKRYPAVSLEQVRFVAPSPLVPVLPDSLRLQLVEGISNDVIVSSLVSPAHFFLQQPTHPTFPALTRLCQCMDATYAAADAPPVPAVQAGIVVAAPVMGSWYRAEVVSVESDADTCQVRYVDYGGYDTQENSALRQIRSDFMTLPFQAAECYLANVCPSSEDGWSPEALTVVEQLTSGQVVQAQVCGYCEDGVPAVCLYAIFGAQVVPIHQELVARGMAVWWEPTEA